MNSNIEQILLAQAAREAEQGPKLSDVVALGAGGGAAIGGLLGTPVHGIGQAVGGMRGTNRVFKPGARMAGGLVGMLIGGGLGAAAQQTARQETGAAGSLLAKIQAQGGLTAEDEMALESILRQAYSQQGLLG